MENAFDENDLPPLCPQWRLLLPITGLSPGHAQGSARHYTLPAILNIQTNFLVPALSLVTRELGSLESRDIREVSILDPGAGDTVATYDLFSVSGIYVRDYSRRGFMKLRRNSIKIIFYISTELSSDSFE